MTAAMHDWQATFRTASQGKTEFIETVVVPLDGSGAAKAALPVARLLTQLYRATLHILYVGEELLGPRETLQELGLSGQEFRGVVLDRLTGNPAEAIVSAMQGLRTPLLVMCTHAPHQGEQTCFGPIAESVLSTVPARVILVAPEASHDPWKIRRVLLAHDGTPSADAAIAPAAGIAHRASAEVIAMHVAARTAPEPQEAGSLPAPRYMDQPQHEWPAWAGEFLDRMLALGAPPAAVNFKLLVTGGQPGSEVAQFARDNGADLVVVTWHGCWEEPRAGTLKVIVRRAGCPVLLINAQEQTAL